MSPTVQSIVRFLLGAILLPVVCAAFLLFCLVALCADKWLVRPKWLCPPRWGFEPHDPAPAGMWFPD